MQTEGTILVVDDNESVNELLGSFLVSQDYAVLSAENAVKGLDIISKGANLDLVITDMMMPGISGIDFLHEIKKTEPELPVVMITGYPSVDIAVKVMRDGASDFISKPFNLDHARLVIKRALDEGRLKRGYRALEVKAKQVDRIESVKRDLEVKVGELSLLSSINDSLHRVFSTPELFEKVLDLALYITGAGKAAIWMADHESSTVFIRAERGMDMSRGSYIRFEDAGLIYDVFKSGKHAVSSDWQTCPCITNNMGLKRPALCAPLSIENNVFAVLHVCDKAGGADFTESDRTIINNLAQKTALRFENLVLYENLTENVIQSISSLVTAIDARDNYTMNHCKRVTDYAVCLAKALDASVETIDALKFTGPIHDVGKIGVRDNILLKPNRLDMEERSAMESHVVIGERIVLPLYVGALERAVVRNHHERFDGGGYPDGLKHDNIPLVARIFSVVDTYDAMTSNRPYRRALTHHVAMEELLKCANTQFDPKVVDAFIKLDINSNQIALSRGRM
ncbi:MAG: response regulator [Deltaproteobacteria bacterium]|nr:response regulator [Deltaproteobacteria bacterium]